MKAKPKITILTPNTSTKSTEVLKIKFKLIEIKNYDCSTETSIENTSNYNKTKE